MSQNRKLPILLLAGPPAAGKTTIAKALSARVERSLVISPDDVRMFIQEGGVHPSASSNLEARHQAEITCLSVCDVVWRFTDAGFFCVVTDAIRNPSRYINYFGAEHLICIYINVSLAEALRRNESRVGKPFQAKFYKSIIESFYHSSPAHVELERWGWTLVDANGELSTAVRTISNLLEYYGIPLRTTSSH